MEKSGKGLQGKALAKAQAKGEEKKTEAFNTRSIFIGDDTGLLKQLNATLTIE